MPKSNKSIEDLNNIRRLSKFSIKIAAENYGMRVSAFKKYCLRYGITDWPRRKIQKIETKIKKNIKIMNRINNYEKKKNYKEKILNLLQEKKDLVDNLGFLESPEVPLMDPILFKTDFFENGTDVKTFHIIHGNNTYIVYLRKQSKCTCGIILKHCPHFNFIMKKVFNQEVIYYSFEQKDFEHLLKSQTFENKCVLCCNPLEDDIVYYPDCDSYGHRKCTEHCLEFIRYDISEAGQLFLKNFKYV